MKNWIIGIITLCILGACNFKSDTVYSTKYTYFFTKRDKVTDSLVKELCSKPWTLFQLENRRFNKRKMVYNDSREFVNDQNSFKIEFKSDSSIITQNPTCKGTWSINNQYFLEFEFTGADTSNHLTGKFDVKMRYDDLIFNRGVYTSDTSSETLKLHFFRNGDEIKILQ